MKNLKKKKTKKRLHEELLKYSYLDENPKNLLIRFSSPLYAVVNIFEIGYSAQTPSERPKDKHTESKREIRKKDHLTPPPVSGVIRNFKCCRLFYPLSHNIIEENVFKTSTTDLFDNK